ncbi:MAG: hypothetical protein EU542_07370 [Promethearchaeota archaeon]|nr:MAG: hypothetical protein EU542_07370 [Candidatus Lokiarchaeota archaeon]
MKKHPEIKWDIIARSALENYIEKIVFAEKIASKSKLTIDDVKDISNEITEKSWQRHKEYLEKQKK